MRHHDGDDRGRDFGGEVEHRLLSLALDVPAPPVRPGEDLARGRAARRRRRLASAGVVAAVVAVVGVGGLAADRLTANPVLPQPVPAASDGSPSPGPSEPPDGTTGATDATDAPAVGYTEQDRPAIDAALHEGLDPGGTHLAHDDQTGESTSSGEGFRSWAMTLGWSVPGDPGLGYVRATIADGWGGAHPDRCRFGRLEVTGTCTPLRLDDGTQGVRVDGADGTLSVVHEQPDGDVVVLSTHRLWGNNSQVALAALPVADADRLLRTAADERLSLMPEGTDVPGVVSSIDLAQALVRAYGDDVEPVVDDLSGGYGQDGRLSGGGRVSTVADPVATAFDLTCDPQWFSSCRTERTSAGEVWVARPVDGGTQVVWRGPVRQVSLILTRRGEGLDLERAAAFVHDAELQTPMR